MTSHGFGRGTVTSSKATMKDAKGLAKEIRKIRAPGNTKVVGKAHVYKLKDKDDFTIRFEFTHLDDVTGYDLANLKKDVDDCSYEDDSGIKHKLHDTFYGVIEIEDTLEDTY